MKTQSPHPDLRNMVLERLKQTGVSRYDLVTWLGDFYAIKPRAVYAWLSGKSETNSRTLSAIFQLLAMNVVVEEGHTESSLWRRAGKNNRECRLDKLLGGAVLS